MFSAVRHLSRAEAFAIELPALAISLAVAEVFYKFHSFLLESAAFLLTWAACGAILTGVRAALTPRT